jgi:hypothetical protein
MGCNFYDKSLKLEQLRGGVMRDTAVELWNQLSRELNELLSFILDKNKCELRKLVNSFGECGCLQVKALLAIDEKHAGQLELDCYAPAKDLAGIILMELKSIGNWKNDIKPIKDLLDQRCETKTRVVVIITAENTAVPSPVLLPVTEKDQNISRLKPGESIASHDLRFLQALRISPYRPLKR